MASQRPILDLFPLPFFDTHEHVRRECEPTGGDCVFIEGSYEQSVIAKGNIAQVFQEKIDEG